MAARSQRLSPPTAIAVGGTDLLTVPGGRVWIVKSLVVVSTAALTVTLSVRLKIGAGPVQLIGTYSRTAGSTADLIGSSPWIFEAGDVVSCAASLAGLSIIAYGSDLTA